MKLSKLHRYYEGRLSEKEQAKIRNWANKKPENRQLLIRERLLYDATTVHKKPAEASGAGLAANRSLLLSRLKNGLKYAAIFLITLVGCGLYYQYRESHQQLLTQTIRALPRQQVEITLPDGTNVRLNSGATLRYPVDFNRKERLVELEGEAYFEVAKDTERMFSVETQFARVKVLRTTFDISVDPAGNVFKAALLEGRIEASLKDSPDQTLQIEAGKMITLRNGSLQVSEIEDYSPYEWRNGLIGFNRKPVREILETLEQTYNIQIIIQNTEISDLSYTGKFRISDGFEYALQILQKDLKFSYERDFENRIIYIK